MMYILAMVVGAMLCFVAFYVVAVTRQHKEDEANITEIDKQIAELQVLADEATAKTTPQPTPTIKPAHRAYSASEQLELSSLINGYITDRYKAGATDMELAQAAVTLAEMYDETLKLRYGVKD